MSLEDTLAAHAALLKMNTEAMAALTRALLGVEKRAEDTPSLPEQRATVVAQEVKAEETTSPVADAQPQPQALSAPTEAAKVEEITDAMMLKDVGKAATVNRARLVEILADFKVQRASQLSQADRAVFMERVRMEILS